MLAAFLCGCGGETDHEAVSTPPTSSKPVESQPAASQSSKPTPSVEPKPEPSPEPSVLEPEEEPGPTNPLTGLAMEEEKINDRPIAVMLNNIQAALPQQGNSMADMIYEVVTEGGITRMLGVYQSLDDVPTIGSVRSSRTCYLELALGHDAIYVHAGGSEEAYAKLDEWEVDHMDGVRGKFSYADAGLFWRDRDRIEGQWYALEHSLVTTGEAIQKNLERSKFRLEHSEGYTTALSFAKDGTPVGGETAKKITVPFSGYKTGVFTYDTETNTYLAEEYGKPYIDGNTGEQVAVTNVLTLRTVIENTGDSKGHTNVKLTGGGDGWFACGGKIVPITWEKAERTEPFRYYTEDGEPLVLGRGKSYVNIISNKNEISFES
jgi:hypothetical protein